MPGETWDFLRLEESFAGDSARVQSLFGNKDEEGFTLGSRRGSRKDTPEYKRALIEALRIIEKAQTGNKRSVLLLEEAMSTSDFPYLFADILDRETLAEYRQISSNWERFIQRKDVASFRPQQIRYPMSGNQSVLDRVDELEEYPEATVSETAPFTWRIYKYGRRFAISWETMVNDELNDMVDLPANLALAARRTEMYNALGLFIDTNGPKASVFTNGNKNIVNQANGAVANNPPLSLAGLQDAMLVAAKQLDAYGQPIVFEQYVLVVPPALEMTARNILNATLVEIGLVGQGANAAPVEESRLTMNNWMTQRIQLEVMPHMPLIASNANGNTSWFLFPVSANGSNARPFARMGFLRGRGEPEIWMKAPNAIRVGGGAVGPEEGDFETDSRAWRVRHCMGSVLIDPRQAVASNGTGSA